MDTQTVDGVRYALGKAPSGIYGATVIKESVKPFYSTGTHGVSESLKECNDFGYSPLFMPELTNARSKANLLSAIHRVVEENKNTAYFPSYEILLDELRDYRFYNNDMLIK